MAYLIARASPGPEAPPPASEVEKRLLYEELPGAPQYFTWHGLRTHYRHTGSGPALLMAHGPDVGASCVEWRRNIGPLSKSFSVFAVDLPGYGLSEAGDRVHTAEEYILFLGDFLKEVVNQQAYVTGSLLGASYLLSAACRWPDRIERIIAVCPTGISALRPSPMRALTYRMLKLPGVSGAVFGSVVSHDAIVDHLQHDVYAEDQVASKLVDTRYWVAHRPDAAEVERCRLAGLLNVDARPAIREIRQPLAVVWGRKAVKPPASDAEVVRELNPDARVVIFERSALAPHEQEPERFNQLVLDFGGPLLGEFVH